MHRVPRVAIASATLACIACASTGAFNSVTVIEPGKTFLLGGEQAGEFVVSGRNTGGVPVIVYTERAGRRDSVTSIEPGGEIDATFPASTIAVFRNGSRSRQATLTLTLRGATSNLGMRYEITPR